MRAVNLLPPDRGVAKTASGGAAPSKQLLVAAGGVMLATVAGLSLLVWSANSGVGGKKTQLASIQSQIDKLPAPVTAAPTSTGAPERSNAVSSLVQDRLSWDGFLGAFSRVLPEDVWLSTMTATAPGAATTLATATAAVATTPGADATATATPAPAVTTAANTFTISGYTYSQPSVARLMRRLTLVPWLNNVNLVSSSKTTVNNKAIFGFTVGANIVPQPGVAS